MCVCWLLPRQACIASRKEEHIEQITERCLTAQKKNLGSRNELRETENIGGRDLDALIVDFLHQVREFLFLIWVKKTISMKILVLRVINSSRHRKILLCTGLYSLVVCVKSPHSLVPRSFGFSHKQLVKTTLYAALSMT